MGMQAEFNWYIVINDPEVEIDPIQVDQDFTFIKEEYRIYPMDTPLPLIYNGKCLGLIALYSLQWDQNQTHIQGSVTLAFNQGDPIRSYYEESFNDYKRKQEKIDDGGKINLIQIVNGKGRVRV